ncbi:MAG: damage-inducible protein DinB, partial [Chloroflexota bacterium]
VHLVAAQGRYLVAPAGWTPNPAIAEDAPFPGFASLREEALRTSDALIEVAERTVADQVLRGVRGGQPYAIPAAVFLIQAINHATEHRAQVATIMGHLGIDAPITDGWAYWQAGQVTLA